MGKAFSYASPTNTKGVYPSAMALVPTLPILLVSLSLLSAPLGSANTAELPQPPAAVTAPVITVDTSQLASLDAYAKKAEALAREWYPKINEILGVEGPPPVSKISIVMDFNYNGVAATSGDRIVCSVAYVSKHPNDLGMIVHELTHVVQAYPKYDPVWLVEGIADYVRFFGYEPQTPVHPNPQKADARDSYRTTAHFLNWAATKYNKDLVKRLNGALRKGEYKEELFKDLTGKTLDELDTEWKATLK